MPDLPAPQDLTNFERLRTLLAPHEAALDLPAGGTLADVDPSHDAADRRTADFQRVVQLGLEGADPSDAFGDEFVEGDAFLLDLGELRASGAAEWRFIADADAAKLAEFDKHAYLLGVGHGGDAWFQIAAGRHRGEVVFIDHETVDPADFDAVPIGGTADEVIDALDDTLEGSGMNLEQCLIELIEDVFVAEEITAAFIEGKLTKKGTRLDLSSMQLEAFPEAVLGFPKLKELDLSDNLIPGVPAGLAALPNLVKLNLHSNVIAELDDAIGTLTKLRDLDLGENVLTRLPEALYDLANLERLNLNRAGDQNGDAFTIPPGTERLKNLRFLSTAASGYRLEGYPAVREATGDPLDAAPVAVALAALAGRRREADALAYVLDHGTAEEAERAFALCYDAGRKSMDLKGHRLDRVPGQLLGFDIEVLNLKGAELGRRSGATRRDPDAAAQDAERTAVLGELTGLRELDLQGNELRGVADLRGLGKLEALRLGKNELVSVEGLLPAGLRELDLEDNQLTAFPATLLGGPVETLNLSGNQLASIPGLGRCVDLRELDLSENDLGDDGFPPELPGGLRRLKMYDCGITSLPDSVFAATDLETLWFAWNFSDGCWEPTEGDVARFAVFTRMRHLAHGMFKPTTARGKRLAEVLPAGCEIAYF